MIYNSLSAHRLPPSRLTEVSRSLRAEASFVAWAIWSASVAALAEPPLPDVDDDEPLLLPTEPNESSSAFVIYVHAKDITNHSTLTNNIIFTENT